ncbi:hypothetical protein [Rhodococcus sp. 14-2470-1a]|nr:hypothetical protein [Rhodococcus sp. 14-2470-1a]
MWLIFVLAAAVACIALWLVLRDPDADRASGYAPSSTEARILRGQL